MKLKVTNPFAKPQHIKDMEATLAMLSETIRETTANVKTYDNIPDPNETKAIDESIARYREITEILETQRKQRLSKEKKAEIIAYLIGILLILNYEHARALTSKATNQLPRILK